MKPIILINGNSGCGKQAVATFLEDRLQYHRFCPDDTRRKLGMTDYDPGDTKEVRAKIDSDISEIISSGGGVILHSPYKTMKGRQKFYDIASGYGSEVLLIECHCPEDIAKGRILSRPQKDSLHSKPTDPAVYDRIAAAWEEVCLDFFYSRNDHVSWIRYDSATSAVEERIVRKGMQSFVSEILSWLPDIAKDR